MKFGTGNLPFKLYYVSVKWNLGCCSKDGRERSKHLDVEGMKKFKKTVELGTVINTPKGEGIAMYGNMNWNGDE